MNRYNRLFKNIFTRIFNRRSLPVIACIAGILVVFILVTTMTGSKNKGIAPEDTAFADQSRILIGVVPDKGSLCQIDESGNASGFECDLLRTVLGELYPNTSIQFTEVESQLASYELRHGAIDLAVGTFPKSITKTDGLSLSLPFQNDGLYAYTAAGSDIDSLAGLRGRTVYLMSTEFPASLATKAFSELSIEVTCVSCSSYPDALDALNSGRAAAIVGPYRRMESKDADWVRIDQRLAEVSYRILAWTENSDVTSLINAKLNEMSESGALNELRRKYGLAAEVTKK